MAERRLLPPLSALRAFEAAARHMSFKLAAHEMHLTASPSSCGRRAGELSRPQALPSAHPQAGTYRRWQCLPVAGQPRFRWDQRGYPRGVRPLSRRHPDRGLLADVFSLLADPALGRVPGSLPRYRPPAACNGRSRPAPSIVHDGPSRAWPIAARGSRCSHSIWPRRMAGFSDRPAGWRGHGAAVHPALRNGPPPLREPADLTGHLLIYTETKFVSWAMWLEAAGVPAVKPKRVIRFNRADMAIHAAMSGLGVALENRAIAAPQLASGALVVPFDLPVPLGQIAAYYLLCRPEKAMLPKVERFRDWVKKTARGIQPSRQDLSSSGSGTTRP